MPFDTLLNILHSIINTTSMCKNQYPLTIEALQNENHLVGRKSVEKFKLERHNFYPSRTKNEIYY